jgi:hypothetical protein
MVHRLCWVAPRLEEAGAIVRVPHADTPSEEHLAWYDEQERNHPQT